MAMPQFADAFGSYGSHISLTADHESGSEHPSDICPHCGSNGACSHAGFAKCDDIEAAKPNVPAKHADGLDEAPLIIGVALADQARERLQTTSVINTGREFLPRPVPIRVVNCVYLK
jgi:hypothetical protein